MLSFFSFTRQYQTLTPGVKEALMEGQHTCLCRLASSLIGAAMRLLILTLEFSIAAFSGNGIYAQSQVGRNACAQRL